MCPDTSQKYDNGDEIKIILNELKISTLEKPKDLDSRDEKVYKEIYKGYVKAYIKENHALTRSAKTLYSLVLGHCT